MKSFLEMIEIVKKKNFIGIRQGRKAVNYDSEMFFHFAEKCVPFVFSKKNDEPVELIYDESKEFPIDAPFKIFSIEVFDSFITVPTDADLRKVKIKCIMVVEQRPKEFLTFGLSDVDGSLNVCMVPELVPLVSKMLQRLNVEATGVEAVRERVKVGIGKNKRTMTVRRIVHVKPKNLVFESTVTSSRKVDWSHRFSVRGHWRKMNGLGKDRDGNYCIENMTWIAEYEKGPEDSPLVNKTRMVKSL